MTEDLWTIGQRVAALHEDHVRWSVEQWFRQLDDMSADLILGDGKAWTGGLMTEEPRPFAPMPIEQPASALWVTDADALDQWREEGGGSSRRGEAHHAGIGGGARRRGAPRST